MSVEHEELIKITSAGTVSIPKQFRKYLEMQKGDYVKILLEGDHLVIKKVIIS
jgi:AbrB family looped-hinge helix DNA binding protein